MAEAEKDKIAGLGDESEKTGGMAEKYREKRQMARFGPTVQNLILHVHQAGKSEPKTKVTIPLSGFHVGEKLLPKKLKEILEREGIDLTGITELYSKKGPKGTLIEIEDSEEKLVIMID